MSDERLRPGAVSGQGAPSRSGVGKTPAQLAQMISRTPTAGMENRGPRGGVIRGERPIEREPAPDKPPPDPTTTELIAAGRERQAYFDYLNGKGPKPELRWVKYWPENA